MIQYSIDLMVLWLGPPPRINLRLLRNKSNRGEIQFAALPVGDSLILIQQIGPPDNIFKFFKTQLCQMFPDLLSDESEIVFHIIGTAVKPFPEFLVLGGHAYRTCIEVTFAHHYTSKYDQGCC